MQQGTSPLTLVENTIANYDLTSTSYVTDPFEYPEFFETIESKENKRILVVGCGPADDAATLKQLGFSSIIGIDLSKGMVEEAHRRHPDIEVKQMAMQDVSKYFNEDTFDILCSQYSMFHIPKKELKQTILGFKRILKWQGYFYLTTQESMTGKPFETHSERYDDANYVYINAETETSLTKLFADCGFGLVFFKRRSPREEEHQFFKLTMVIQKLSK